MAVGLVEDDYEPPPFPAVLCRDEAVRCYREGVAAYRAGKFFHDIPYPHSGDRECSDEDYERGYHWRRGWNDTALADGAKNLGRPHGEGSEAADEG